MFVVSFTTFLVHGIDYPLLFGDKPPPDGKLKIPDIILSWDEFHSSFGFYTYLLLVTAAFVWALRLLRGIYNTFHFWDIKQFYNCALGIDDSQLDNLTWHEVQTKVSRARLPVKVGCKWMFCRFFKCSWSSRCVSTRRS